MENPPAAEDAGSPRRSEGEGPAARVGRRAPPLVGRWAALLLVLAGLFTNLTFMSVWAWRTVASSDGFADALTSTLDDPDVRAGLADQIVRAMETRDLTAKFAVTVQPLLTEVVRDVLATDAFKAIFRAGVRELHASFVRGHQSLLVQVDDAIPIVKEGLRVFNPALADAIPDGQLRVLVGISQSSLVDRVMIVSAKASWAVVPLAFVSLGLFACAIAAAPVKRRAVQTAGAILTLTGVVVLILLGVARHDVSLTGRSAGESRAIVAIVGVMTGLLDAQAKAAVIAGVVVVLAATFAARPASKARLSTRLRAVPDEIHRRPALRLAAAAVVIAVAISGLVEPTATFRFAVQAAACVGLVVAAVAALEVLGASRWGVERDGPGRRRARRVLGLATLSVAGVALVLLVAGTVIIEGMRAPHPRAVDPDRNGCNGHIELCDRRLDEVTFVGTHNSMSVAGAPGGWLMTRQTKGLLPQLREGVRAFLLDLHYGVPTTDVVRTDFLNELEGDRGDIAPSATELTVLHRLFAMLGATSATTDKHVYLCHDFCELGSYSAERAFRLIDDFLRDHPEQVVLLILDDHVSSQDAIQVLERSGLSNRAYAWTPGTPLPTLRQMITSGHNVLITAERRSGPAPWYLSTYTGLIQDTPYAFPSVKAMNCELARGDPSNPLLLVNHWLDVDTATPVAAAEPNNAAVLRNRLDRCAAERRHRVNIVAVDFYTQGDVLRVVDEMNEVVPRPARSSHVS